MDMAKSRVFERRLATSDAISYWADRLAGIKTEATGAKLACQP
jgi:hypothetical protein